jgi:hypothetical protein
MLYYLLRDLLRERLEVFQQDALVDKYMAMPRAR